MKSLTDYTIILRPDDNRSYVAYIPAIKGCHAWGETHEEARSELNHVFEMIHQEYLEAGQNLPDDVKVKRKGNVTYEIFVRYSLHDSFVKYLQ